MGHVNALLIYGPKSKNSSYFWWQQKSHLLANLNEPNKKTKHKTSSAKSSLIGYFEKEGREGESVGG